MKQLGAEHEPNQYNVERGLDKARDSFPKGSKSTVSSEKKITFNGLPGREITFQRKQGGTLVSRMILDLKGAALYQMVVGAGDGNVAFPEAQAFLDSLAIVK